MGRVVMGGEVMGGEVLYHTFILIHSGRMEGRVETGWVVMQSIWMELRRM